MALTVSIDKNGVFGDYQYRLVTVTWDSSYPTGGEALTPGDVGLVSVIAAFNAGGAYDAQGTVIPAYDAANSKLVAYGADGAAADVTFLKEVANTKDLSTITSSLFFLGK